MSPAGGKSPLEPRSLKRPNYDKSARAWRENPARMALLESTASPDQVDSADYDAIYFTGGHAVMFDFPGSEGLQRITREIYRRFEGKLALNCEVLQGGVLAVGDEVHFEPAPAPGG